MVVTIVTIISLTPVIMLKETKNKKKLTLNQHPFLNNYGKNNISNFQQKTYIFVSDKMEIVKLNKNSMPQNYKLC
jgi:hypothetical protein